MRTNNKYSRSGGSGSNNGAGTKRSFDPLFDDEKEEFLRRRRGPFTLVSSSSSSNVANTFQTVSPIHHLIHDAESDQQGINSNDNDDDADAQIRELADFGTLYKQSVVGVRHYQGLINADEYVHLFREPNNPFDRNAIRVDNKSNVQVGYLSREVAAVLAPLIDSGSLWIEGVAVGEKATYRLPINIRLFGLMEQREAVVEILRSNNLRPNVVDADSDEDGSLSNVVGNNSLERMIQRMNDAPQLTNQQVQESLEEERPLLARRRNEILRRPEYDLINGMPEEAETYKYHISHNERNAKTLPGYDVLIKSYSVVSIRRRPQDREHNRIISAAHPEKIIAVDVNLKDVSPYIASVNPDIVSAFSGAISFVLDNEERSTSAIMENLVIRVIKLSQNSGKYRICVGVPLAIYKRIVLCLRTKGCQVNEQVQDQYGWMYGEFTENLVIVGSLNSAMGVPVPLGDPIALTKALGGTALLCNVSIGLRLSSYYASDVTLAEAKVDDIGLKCTVHKCFVLGASHVSSRF